jgi:hypothetical protein
MGGVRGGGGAKPFEAWQPPPLFMESRKGGVGDHALLLCSLLLGLGVDAVRSVGSEPTDPGTPRTPESQMGSPHTIAAVRVLAVL